MPVPVPVMGVGEMRVAVEQVPVLVSMRVAGSGRERRRMRVVVMGVVGTVHMRMFVRLQIVPVPVLMPLAQMQRHAGRHQRTGQQQLGRNRIAK